MNTAQATSYQQPSNESGWQARLELGLARRGAGTALVHTCHEGPLRVQRPFYPEGQQLCHVYLLHPPGGMVTGDRLHIDITVTEQAQALLTTPSAGKIYLADESDRQQQQFVNLTVAESASLEWLPQETIVFDGARGELHTRLRLAAGAKAVLWDIVCLGRPASGETFNQGYLVQNLLVERQAKRQIAQQAEQSESSDVKTLYRERNCFIGGSDLLKQPWGMAGFVVSGSMLLTLTLEQEVIAQWHEHFAAMGLQGLLGLSQMDDLLLIRYMGPSAEECRRCFEHLWQALRPALLERPAERPRIWNT